MLAGNGLFYPLLGFASCVVFIYMTLGDLRFLFREPKMEFVGRNGTQFVVGGKEFYVNGWNSYWLMDQAVEEYSRPRVTKMLQAGAKMGLTVCRTWAFNDAGYNALQLKPGKFDERVFKALDRVIAEARYHGIRLILCLVNNLHAYGGKAQYVQWAWEEGSASSRSNDSFFSDSLIRQHFKDYVKALLTRRNSFTGVEYRNDPTIFAWELMNEPRCTTDPSGGSLQSWIKEMSEFVKSIDNNHMLTVGVEGFYGAATAKKLHFNPGDYASILGTDFIKNSKIAAIDFASVHTYPDSWCPGFNFTEKMKFVLKWISSHIDDGDRELKKPVLFAEFGLSSKTDNFQTGHRYQYYKKVYDLVYESAKAKRSGAGAMPWQFLVDDMDEYGDAFAIVPWRIPSIYRLITRQSCRLAAIRRDKNPSKFLAECS
ncbi:unnamed protein product [Victoria cruziana]